MRVIKTYRFKIGTKIPFSDWPEIVHSFLDAHGLQAHHFLYYFMDFLPLSSVPKTDDPKGQDKYPVTESCARALKDCPAFGPIKYTWDPVTPCLSHLYLSNIDDGAVFSESDILPLMKKLHRRYGFCHCDLYYADIDFFGNIIPWERDYRHAKWYCDGHNIPYDATAHLDSQPYGSMIWLHREVGGWNIMDVSIDLLHHGTIHDPSIFYDTIHGLLHGIRSEEFTKYYFTEEERAAVRIASEAAKPVEQSCKAFFQEALKGSERQNLFSSQYSIAATLKKLSKKNEYTYKYDGDHRYRLQKRTENGHWLILYVVSDPFHSDVGFELEFQCLGYRSSLFSLTRTPCNQEELDKASESVMKAVSEFQDSYLPDLCAAFPTSPPWFVPIPPWSWV